MFRTNPFSYINLKKIENKIVKLKKRNDSLALEEMAQILIRSKAYKCFILGFIVSLPALVPGLGTVFALLGGIVVDIMVLGYLFTELILEIAALYNRNLDTKDTVREAVWVFISAVGSDIVGRGLNKSVVFSMSAASYLKLVRQLFWTLGTRVTGKSIFTRVIPLFGALISGTVNYTTARLIGNRVLKYYQSNYIDNWDGITINAEYKVEK
ncbi:hypothetical protein [Desulfolucanica intricata]|uniref:hypothetical protein n=1 Tax=Desulfolucanica intricata TaxID=1285191 RepID=UPI000832A7A3|nr:hypothetical protein [Desulfolucanica intricata]